MGWLIVWWHPKDGNKNSEAAFEIPKEIYMRIRPVGFPATKDVWFAQNSVEADPFYLWLCTAWISQVARWVAGPSFAVLFWLLFCGFLSVCVSCLVVWTLRF